MIWWTPCVAHCLDLMLEDIGKIEWVKKCVEEAKFITRYIYNHTSVLNLIASSCISMRVLVPLACLWLKVESKFQGHLLKLLCLQLLLQLIGGHCPNLQKFAIRILSQTCNAFGCERNWSVFECIHTKKHNCLERKWLNGMVFVQYNLRLRCNQSLKKTPESSNIVLDDLIPHQSGLWRVRHQHLTTKAFLGWTWTHFHNQRYKYLQGQGNQDRIPM
jgi:hypothetical protein